MDDGVPSQLLEKIHRLSDLELATLTSLVAEQHCIIGVEADGLDGVVEELQLIASTVFGLSNVVLPCHKDITVEEFGEGVLVDDSNEDGNRGDWNGDEIPTFYTPRNSLSPDYGQRRRRQSPGLIDPLSMGDGQSIPNLVIATDLNLAHENVQIQGLELIRNKRIFTRKAVHVAPKPFLLIVLTETGSMKLTQHLNDHMMMSHIYSADDGLPNLEEHSAGSQSGSLGSVIRTPTPSKAHFDTRPDPRVALFKPAEIDHLKALTAKVRLSSDIRAYIHNIAVFLRVHRFVRGGISALATRHSDLLSRTLASLHGLDYVTPNLVQLAARKVYEHRVQLVEKPEDERSTMWGSEAADVTDFMEGWDGGLGPTVEGVIEDVLGGKQGVEAPL